MGILRDGTDLLADVRRLSDMENTDFVSDAEIYQWLTDSFREAYMVLAESYEDWNLSSDDITTVAGTRDYAVAADFIRLRKVTYVRDVGTSTEREYPIKRENWNATDGGPLYERVPRRYRLQGSNLRLFPVPNAVHTYRVWYVAAPAVISAASTNVDFQYGLDRFVVWDAVVKALIKEKSPAKEATAERDRCLQLAIRSADNRDAAEPMQIQETQYQSDSDWWDYTW